MSSERDDRSHVPGTVAWTEPDGPRGARLRTQQRLHGDAAAAQVQPHGFVAQVGRPSWCGVCGLAVGAHRAWAATGTAAAAHLHAELVALRAELKDCQRDTEGLMYERRDGQLVLRAGVRTADTNGDPADADARIQAARGHVADLLDFMEDTQLVAAALRATRPERVAAALEGASAVRRRVLLLAVQGAPEPVIGLLTDQAPVVVHRQLAELYQRLDLTGADDAVLTTELVLAVLQAPTGYQAVRHGGPPHREETDATSGNT